MNVIEDLTKEEIKLYNSLRIISFPFLVKNKSKEEIIDEQNNFEKKLIFLKKRKGRTLWWK